MPQHASLRCSLYCLQRRTATPLVGRILGRMGADEVGGVENNVSPPPVKRTERLNIYSHGSNRTGEEEEEEEATTPTIHRLKRCGKCCSGAKDC